MKFVDTLLSETAFPSLKTIELFGILGVSAISDVALVSCFNEPISPSI